MSVNLQQLSQQCAAVPGLSACLSSALYPGLKGELPVLVVNNALGRAVIALQGAHVLSFQPAGKNEMLWLSPNSLMQPGEPIRGGIPLCLPWFADHQDGCSPKHGFGRLLEWQLTEASVLPDASTRLLLELRDDKAPATWPHAFLFQVELLVGKTLTFNVRVENHSDTDAPFAFLWHSYFSVGQVSQASVQGLDGVSFLDKVHGMQMKQQSGPVTLSGTMDSVYYDVPATQKIQCPQGNWQITSETACAVVWNIGANDEKVADIGAGNHAAYLCVERGDVVDRARTIPAHGVYTAHMELAAA